MDFYEVIHARRAVREYKPDDVPEAALKKMLDAANWAPSGMNLQQWEFIVVKGEKKQQIAESYFPYVQERLAAIKNEEKRNNALENARNFGGAPVLVIALTDASDNPSVRKMHLESVSAAFENLLLAACAEGLGSCWMTGPLQADSAIRRILDIPDSKEIAAVTPIGYPNTVPAAPARIDPELQVKVRWAE